MGSENLKEIFFNLKKFYEFFGNYETKFRKLETTVSRVRKSFAFSKIQRILTPEETMFLRPQNEVLQAAKIEVREKCYAFFYTGGNLFPRPQKPEVFAGIKNRRFFKIFACFVFEGSFLF